LAFFPRDSESSCNFIFRRWSGIKNVFPRKGKRGQNFVEIAHGMIVWIGCWKFRVVASRILRIFPSRNAARMWSRIPSMFWRAHAN